VRRKKNKKRQREIEEAEKERELEERLIKIVTGPGLVEIYLGDLFSRVRSYIPGFRSAPNEKGRPIEKQENKSEKQHKEDKKQHVFRFPDKDAEDLEIVRQELFEGVKELIQDEASEFVRGAQEVGEVLQGEIGAKAHEIQDLVQEEVGVLKKGAQGVKDIIQEEVEMLAQGVSQVKDYSNNQTLQDTQNVTGETAEEKGDELPKKKKEIKERRENKNVQKDDSVKGIVEGETETMKRAEVKLIPLTVLLVQPSDFFSAEG